MINPMIANIFIDSCAFDPKCDPESTASLEIFRFSEQHDIPIHIAHSTEKEVEHPNTPGWVKEKAHEFICTIPLQITLEERRILHDIEIILAGNGKIENIAQDACHLFEAQKYGSYFVTTDNGILRHSEELYPRIRVLKPSEFWELLQNER